MKTQHYNPSDLEILIAEAIVKVQSGIQEHLAGTKISEVRTANGKDNPTLHLHLIDQDGDPHEVVLKIIQVPDKF